MCLDVTLDIVSQFVAKQLMNVPVTVRHNKTADNKRSKHNFNKKKKTEYPVSKFICVSSILSLSK